jgi:O-antigen/teichoic acid export membrane protein
MDVVARQSIKYSFVGYFSFFIGTLATIFLYPSHLEFYGKIRYILPTAEIILPLVTLGIAFANVKFYPKLSSTNDHYNLLKFSVIFILINFVFVLLCFLVLGYFSNYIQSKDFWTMRYYIFALVFLLSFLQLFSRYISIKKRIVVPNILENSMPKFGGITAFVCYYYLGYSEVFSITVFIAFFILSLIIMTLYLLKLEPLPKNTSFSFLRQDNFKKELFTYSFYTLLGSIGSIIALRIDNFMIGEFIGFKANGVYSIAFSIVGLISVPSLGIYTIASPIIADYIAKNNIEALQKFHQKTSLYLFFIGALLLSMIVVGIDNLFVIIKGGKQLMESKNVIYILGLATLFDLATGFNGYIISYSKYYKFNIVSMLFLSVVTIIANLLFITYSNLGITGVAIATFISLTLFNLLKINFNYRKFKVHPFSKNYIFIILLLVFSIITGSLLPVFSNNLINLFFKPIVVLIVFISGNHFFKIIPIHELLPKKLKNLFIFLPKNNSNTKN